jgi:metal-dependent amidase/aminoacylase/carboxypeptidase family protein
VQVYRHIHQHPEIGLEEHKTSAFIRDIIAAIDGVDLEPPLLELPTAIIARITVPHPTNCILLRCELDALSFKEQSDLPHRSLN